MQRIGKYFWTIRTNLCSLCVSCTRQALTCKNMRISGGCASDVKRLLMKCLGCFTPAGRLSCLPSLCRAVVTVSPGNRIAAISLCRAASCSFDISGASSAAAMRCCLSKSCFFTVSLTGAAGSNTSTVTFCTLGMFSPEPDRKTTKAAGINASHVYNLLTIIRAQPCISLFCIIFLVFNIMTRFVEMAFSTFLCQVEWLKLHAIILFSVQNLLCLLNMRRHVCVFTCRQLQGFM